MSAPGGVPPRARLPLLVLGFVSLAAGVLGGLTRIGVDWPPAPAQAPLLHGALMVSGFFGTVISLERAVALDRTWAYSAPLAAGLGGLALLGGMWSGGFALLALGALALVGANAAIIARQASVESATLGAGAACWLVGNGVLVLGEPVASAVPWWIGFFVLTIGGERLELSRYAPRPPAARRAFVAIAAAILLAALLAAVVGAGGWRVQGAALIALAAWLWRFDIARITVRQQGLARYIAVCILSGYLWLAVGGLALTVGGEMHAGPLYDLALHALMLGFVFAMVFGHAPVILPAILRVAIPYSAWLYLPLALLHASLALRALGDLAGLQALRGIGAAGNALAIAVFIATAATLALRQKRATGGSDAGR
ncbi:MAG: hypothetical protein R3357_08285 [Burkholderiales bacterium]|nr:hypothetical protein [Burkholderiales bacterium]